MLSFLQYLLLEAKNKTKKVSGGEGADKRGDTNEVAFHQSAQNYNDKVNELMKKGKSRNEAHHAAIKHLTSDDHLNSLVDQVSHSKNKKVRSLKRSSKADFEHTVQDSAHGAAQYLSMLHKERGPIDTSQPHILTGKDGEKKTADKIGATNADMVTPIIAKGGEKKYAALNISSKTKSGSSLKYGTEKAKHIKIRTHGEAAFHGAIKDAATSVLGENHPHVQALEKAQTTKLNAARRLQKGKWHQHFNVDDENDDLGDVSKLIQKHIVKKNSKGKILKDESGNVRMETLSGSFKATKSHLRKIRDGRSTRDSGVEVSERDKKAAAKHLERMEQLEAPHKKSRIEYTKHVTNLLNSMYDRAGPKNKSANEAISKMHRSMAGVFPKEMETANIEVKKGVTKEVPVIRTHLVSTVRGERNQAPSVGIYNLADRLENVSNNPSTKFKATATAGGTVNIHHGDDHLFNTSLDKSSGTIVKISPEKTNK